MRKSLFLRLDSTGFRRAPQVELAPAHVGEPHFQGAFRVGEVLEIDAQVQPGDTVSMPIPLPDLLSDARAQDLQVVHLVDGKWQVEQVVEVRDGAAWTRMTSFSPVAVAVGLVQTPRSLAAGGWHLLWVRNGRMWGAGVSDYGQLGNQNVGGWRGGFAPVHWPSTVPVVAVAAGLRHSLALDSIGNVWAWGDNRQGQCGWPVTGGNGLASFVRPFKVVDAILDTSRRIVQIAAGDSTSYAVTASRRVLSWGANGHRQLGRGGASFDSAYEVIPKFVTKTVNAVSVPLEGVLQVAAGEKHALALLSSGLVQGWGGNDVYQLGSTAPVGNQREPVDVKIAREAYGADTTIVSGCSGPNNTGCWSQKLIRPWFEAPSLIGAGGNSSYTKLFRTSSQGVSALNLVWGANDSGRILAGSIAPQKDPVVVSTRGQNMLELGRSHLLEAYNVGATYYPAPINAALTLYPVFARGANLSRQSDPGIVSNKVGAWKEIVRAGQVTRMMSSALAAGTNFSASWDGRLDSVYVWGESWGLLQKLTRTEEGFLEIVSPRDGDTIPPTVDSIPCVWRYWQGQKVIETGIARGRPYGCDAAGRCKIGWTVNGHSASVRVFCVNIRMDAVPLVATVDRRKGLSSFGASLSVPFNIDSGSFFLWPLCSPQKPIAKAKFSRLERGVKVIQRLDWVDSLGRQVTPPDGSYGISAKYKFVGVKAEDSVSYTTVSSEKFIDGSRIFSGMNLGGPDSVRFSLPSPGLIVSYLQTPLRNPKTVKLRSGCMISGPGDVVVENWNMDTLGVPIYDDATYHAASYRWQSVVSGITFVGQGCIDDVRLNSFRVDAFYSGAISITGKSRSNCQLTWSRQNSDQGWIGSGKILPGENFHLLWAPLQFSPRVSSEKTTAIGVQQNDVFGKIYNREFTTRISQ